MTEPVSRRGVVVTSIVAQVTFLAALVASAVIAWVKNDYSILMAMVGVAATNATTVVNYWVGSSDGSSKKTDLMAAATVPPTVTSPLPEPPVAPVPEASPHP